MQHHLEALKGAKSCPVWHDPNIMPDVQPALSQDKKCELLIVGGGFTGLWAAMQTKERKPDADIILIEQTFVGDGASGRCGGVFNASLAHGESNVEHRFADEAERLDKLGAQNAEELLETLERYNIDARYQNTGFMGVALDPESAVTLKAEYEEALAEGEGVTWFDRDAVRQQVNSPIFHAGLWYTKGKDGIVDPARLCWGLKDVLLNQLGVRIYEDTQLLRVEPDGSQRMKAYCAGGVIISDKVMMATNAFTSPVRKMRSKIIPVWDYQIATKPLTEEQLEKVRWGKSRMAIDDYRNMFHYYRMTMDNRITYGGGGSVRYYFNRGTDPELGNAEKTYERLAKEFFETFPQLADVKFSNKWGGIIATSTRFCMVPGVAYNGRLAWSVGYTGSGVAPTRFGARIGIELLGYQPSDILDMKFVTGKVIPWAPEPFRWIGVRITQKALIKADKNGGKRGLWLRFLDFLGLGFTC